MQAATNIFFLFLEGIEKEEKSTSDLMENKLRLPRIDEETTNRFILFIKQNFRHKGWIFYVIVA